MTLSAYQVVMLICVIIVAFCTVVALIEGWGLSA